LDNKLVMKLMKRLIVMSIHYLFIYLFLFLRPVVWSHNHVKVV